MTMCVVHGRSAAPGMVVAQWQAAGMDEQQATTVS